jgi:predicted hydrocarbon binding protein
MNETKEKRSQQDINSEIVEELLDLSDELKKKAAELESKGLYEKAAICHFLAGYLKGTVELWRKE